MKSYVLDESRFSDTESFYDEAASVFGFSEDFWRNLDALADALSDYSGLSDYERPCEVVWKSCERPGLSSEFRETVFEIFHETEGISFRILPE